MHRYSQETSIIEEYLDAEISKFTEFVSLPTDIDLLFKLSFYCSRSIINIVDNSIVTQKVRKALQREPNLSQSIIRDEYSLLLSNLFNTHRDVCFLAMLYHSEVIIGRLIDANDSWANVLSSFINNVHTSIKNSFIKTGVNVGNISTEAIFSIVQQATLDMHRASSTKGSMNISNITGIIQGATPKIPMFRYIPKRAKSEEDVINFLATQIHNVVLEDLMLDHRLTTINSIVNMNARYPVFGFDDYKNADALVITIDLEKQAVFGVATSMVVSKINDAMTKYFKHNTKTMVHGTNSKIDRRNYNVLVIFRLMYISSDVKETLINSISGIKRKEGYKKKMETLLNEANTLASILGETSITSDEYIAANQRVSMLDSYNSSLDKDAEFIARVSSKITEEYTTDNMVFTKYIIGSVIDDMKKIHVSGVPEAELPNFDTTRLDRQFDNIYRIDDSNYIVILDSLKFKVNGFIGDVSKKVKTATNGDLSFVKVSSCRFNFDDINKYDVVKYLDIVRRHTQYKSSIHVQGNNILFYPFIESKLILMFKQSLLNNNLPSSKLDISMKRFEETVYFDGKYMLTFNRPYAELITGDDTRFLLGLLSKNAKEYISILNSVYPPFKYNDQEFNVDMEYSKHFIIKLLSDRVKVEMVSLDDLYSGEHISRVVNEVLESVERNKWSIFLDNIRSFVDYCDHQFEPLKPRIRQHVYDELSEDDGFNAVLDYILDHCTFSVRRLGKDMIVGFVDRLMEKIRSQLEITDSDVRSVVNDNENVAIMNSIRAKILNSLSTANEDASYIERQDLIGVILGSDRFSSKTRRYDHDYVIDGADSVLLGDREYYLVNDTLLNVVRRMVTTTPNKYDIASVVGVYSIEAYVAKSFNGDLADYKNTDIVQNYIYYQDIAGVDANEGVISACNAYYTNILIFFGENGLKVNARHIDIRADSMTYSGRFDSIGISSIMSKRDYLQASRRDPRTIFKNTCKRNPDVIDSSSVITGAGPSFGDQLAYRVVCRDQHCLEVSYEQPIVVDPCAEKCRMPNADHYISDDYTVIDIDHINATSEFEESLLYGTYGIDGEIEIAPESDESFDDEYERLLRDDSAEESQESYEDYYL